MDVSKSFKVRKPENRDRLGVIIHTFLEMINIKHFVHVYLSILVSGIQHTYGSCNHENS